MKHLKIFEEHNEIPDIARSVFGLEKSFKIFDVTGDTEIRISGPLEEEDNVAPIIKSIHSGILALAAESTVRFDIKNAWRIAFSMRSMPIIFALTTAMVKGQGKDDEWSYQE